MSNRSRDIKISELTGISTLADSDLITVVQGGTNYKLTYADLKAQLGVTGTLEQQGAATGTPVLNKAGTVNNIRNLESGSGIDASVSAQNGITIKHNFTQDVTGVPVLLNPTATSPTIASIAAGTGISVTAAGDAVEISLAAEPVGNKTVLVNELSDLPTPVAEVITLETETNYFFSADVDLGANRLVMAMNTVLSGSDSSTITLTYTGTGAMITATSVDSRVKELTLTATAVGSSMFALSCLGNSVIEVDNAILTAYNLGSATGYKLIEFDDTDITVTNDGMDFTSTNNELLCHNCRYTVTAGTMFDLGTATFDSVTFDLGTADVASGATFLSGAAASANINTGGLGSMTLYRFSGLGTPLSGVTAQDALWQFVANSPLEDTRPDGLLSMQGNATATVIAVAGTPVLAAGTWVVESVSQATGSTAGRITYDGGRDAKLPITASLSVEPVTGGTVSISVEVAINGSVVSGSKRTGSTSSGNSTSITVPWQATLSTSDYVEVFVTNEDSTANILVSSAVLRVN